MARNQFGVICDKCGKMEYNKKVFFRLVLPTYESEWANCTRHQDYCPECYKDLKKCLANHYNIKYEVENAE